MQAFGRPCERHISSCFTKQTNQQIVTSSSEIKKSQLKEDHEMRN